jgi:cytoskeletal protein CcmA (bactofilin family)
MKQRTPWRRMGLVGILLLLLMMSVPGAHAFESKEGDTVMIGADTVVDDDLYVAAGELVVDGTIEGDLYAAGQTITINGTVEGDITVAGRDITINGNAGDDVRLAGAAVVLGPDAWIGDDVLVAGYSLDMQAGSGVAGDLLFTGQQALLAGEVNQDLLATSGGVEFQGRVGGDMQVAVGSPEDMPPFDARSFFPNMQPIPSVAPGLTFGEDAEIGGDLEYASKQPASIPAEQVGGNIQRAEWQRGGAEAAKEGRGIGGWLLEHLRRLVVLSLIGLLLVWLVPTWFSAQEKPLPGLGWGALILIGFPLLMILVLIGFILLVIILGGPGFVAGLSVIVPLVMGFWVAAAYLAKVIVGYVGGRAILGRLSPRTAERMIWSVLAGIGVIVVVTALPVLGGLVNLLVSMAGLGAMWLAWRAGTTKVKAAA